MLYRTKIKLISMSKETCSKDGGGFKETGRLYTEWQDPNDFKSGWFQQIFDDKEQISYITSFLKLGDIIPVMIFQNSMQPYIVYFLASVLNPDNLDLLFINKDGEIDYRDTCRKCKKVFMPDESEIKEGHAWCNECTELHKKKYSL